MATSNKLYIMNSPIITSYGAFDYVYMSKEKAKQIIKYNRNSLNEDFTGSGNVISAIGHEATAEFLSKVLGMPIPMNRIAVSMKPGDAAIVIKLLQRLPEGKILTAQEMNAIPVEFGYLKMNASYSKIR
ncbi:MAG: YddF family protein [Thermoplasmataceae archaeon]